MTVASAAEASELARVVNESFASNDWLFKPSAAMAEEVASRMKRGQIFLTARLGFTTVGALAINLDDGVARLEMLSVVPQTRRRGIGARLLAYAESEAAARGCQRMEIVTADELGLATMFVNAGFSVAEREMVYQDPHAHRPFCRVRYERQLR